MVCSYIAPVNRKFFINLITKSTTLSHLAQSHAQILVNGYRNDISTLTKLTHKLCDLKALNYAHTLFLSIPKPDLFLFNVVIKGYSNNGSPEDSILLYTHLRNHVFLKPDNFTYAFTVSASSGLRTEKVGVLLHGQAVVDGFGFDLFVGSSLVDMYFGFSRVEYAKKVFAEMPEKDTVLWNTVISGFVKNCCFEDAVGTFVNMFGSGRTRLDLTSVAAVLPAAAELQWLKLGMGVHCLAKKLGLDSHDHVITGLISLYSKCGEMRLASLLFEDIHRPDIVSYNAIISGYTVNGETECSVRLFKEVLASGERVNSSTLVGLIPVGSPFGHLNLARSIHCFCVKSGILLDSAASTALTTVYSRLNEMGSARQVFDESVDKTLAAWNAMISGYAQNGLTEEAIILFQDMQASKVQPNPVTVTSILSACAQLGALSLGKWVHDLIKKEGFQSNIFVMTALIDMYAKCGNITEARLLFNMMPEKNVVTWNSMISAYGLHGHGHEALNLFTQMVHSGISPSAVTFLSVLYACSHAGLVNEGERIFLSMVDEYGFKPLAEHYACMVDILGRAGKLKEALEFIEQMPVEPGPVIWGSLLGACMVHKDTKLAHLASEKLFELEPENVGYHVLLSNIYSTEKNFWRAASIRQVVKHRNLTKTPGCT